MSAHRIRVSRSLVNLEGDEMAQIMWQMIKATLIEPFLEIKLETFDLSIQERDRTEDRVTKDAAKAIRLTKAAVKCATITPDEERVREFGLKKMWKSPNGTLRNLLGGAIFREPVVCANVPRYVSGWKKPIVIARHAYGDQYSAVNFRAGPGQVFLTHVAPDGTETREHVTELQGLGVVMGMHNTESSVEEFARLNFVYALERGMNLYFSTKNTILKAYDGMFRDIFAAVYAREFEAAFKQAGLTYEHRLIDDLVAYAIKSEGGFLWACKNYDGDVQSDMVAQGFGSLGLMKSVLLSENGEIRLAEAAHGTVTRHYRKWQKGESTSTNPMASVFAWSGGLAHVAALEHNAELAAFAADLERACVATVERGVMTADLAALTGGRSCDTATYLNAVADELRAVALARRAAA